MINTSLKTAQTPQVLNQNSKLKQKNDVSFGIKLDMSGMQPLLETSFTFLAHNEAERKGLDNINSALKLDESLMAKYKGALKSLHEWRVVQRFVETPNDKRFHHNRNTYFGLTKPSNTSHRIKVTAGDEFGENIKLEYFIPSIKKPISTTNIKPPTLNKEANMFEYIKEQIGHLIENTPLESAKSIETLTESLGISHKK